MLKSSTKNDDEDGEENELLKLVLPELDMVAAEASASR